MRITQWGEYGVLCALHIAKQERAGVSPVGAAEIAEELGFSLEYAQQILQRLRKGGIVDSVRGPLGGYRLTNKPPQVSLLDVLLASEGETFEVICEARPLDPERCGKERACALRPVWFELRDHVNSFLTKHTLETLLARGDADRQTPQDSVPIQLGSKA